MKQMVDSAGVHWDWDYRTNSWVLATRGVFADEPPAGEPIRNYPQHTTPEGTYIHKGSSWFQKYETAWQEVATPATAITAVPPLIVKEEYIAPDTRAHFDCPSCGDAAMLRHEILRTRRERIQCAECEQWAEVA